MSQTDVGAVLRVKVYVLPLAGAFLGLVYLHALGWLPARVYRTLQAGMVFTKTRSRLVSTP